MANLVITIDGPAGSGKSTMARLLAEKTAASFLDTGAMYRAVTLAAMQAGADMENEKELLDVLRNNDFQFSAYKNRMTVLLNDINVTEQIRTPEVTLNSRHIASKPGLREKLVEMQQEFADSREKIVTEGRDQGTVAFPNANIKFFLTADETERAQRRLAELQAKGNNQDIEEIQKAIEKRDTQDQNRTVGPLKPAADAIIIDTTNLSIEQVLEKLLDHIS
ncbi:MAG: (d)CMP kinase [Planctomycetota bacterium]|jgi:cytidylate kinase